MKFNHKPVRRGIFCVVKYFEIIYKFIMYNLIGHLYLYYLRAAYETYNIKLIYDIRLLKIKFAVIFVKK